ncbi:MAG: hypothetical protein QOF33_2889, partial [Thermomicrobiales bacterium]|nr:hypothetical protein [Thermomicrobiales bacterium]
GNYIACGDIGGVVDANGQLVVGLAEVNDSGFTGIAFLAPNADDPNSTDVSTFIAPTGAGGGGGTTGGGDATPTG